MKTKFIAATALVVWLGVTGWLATMVIVKPAVLHLGHDADETAQMVELRMAIDHNARMQQRIAQLRQGTFPDDGRALLALPSAATVESGDVAAMATRVGGDAGALVEHAVTAVLETNGRRSAIIDGRLVRSGARLGDGSRVRSIGRDSVSIENPEGERVVRTVPSPFLQQAARGGGQ